MKLNGQVQSMPRQALFKLNLELEALKNDLFNPKEFFNRRYQNKHVVDMQKKLDDNMA